MRTTPGGMRQGGVAIVVAGLLLALSGMLATAWAASAKPTKPPDTTPNDHPSGKDRTEPQPSGASSSDPDGMTNGGADKPGGSGGFDADKDGNNGCGNDDDFEDDNNGNCGGRRNRGAAAAVAAAGRPQPMTSSSSTAAAAAPAPAPLSESAAFVQRVGETTSASPAATMAGAGTTAAGDTHVLGTSFVRDDAAVQAVDSYVLGGAVVQGERPAALAATGLMATAMAALAAVLIGLGAVLVGVARRSETSLA